MNTQVTSSIVGRTPTDFYRVVYRNFKHIILRPGKELEADDIVRARCYGMSSAKRIQAHIGDWLLDSSAGGETH